MGRSTTHLAIDVGTSSGTCVLGTIGPDELHVREVHRFDTRLLDDDNRREWQLDHLVPELVRGIRRAAGDVGRIESIGLDATAAGFGFLADGAPLRDPAREGTARPSDASHRQAFVETGHRRLPLTYYYIYREHRDLVERADTLLLAPQLLGHQLGADPAGEVTYAISAGLGNTRTRSWATTVLDEWGLPTDILPAMRPHGAAVGTVSPRRGSLDGAGLETRPSIRVVAGHDTSSAVASIPFGGGDRAFLATGSWFIPGFEVTDPVVSDAVFDMQAENVGGVAGTSRFVRNIIGFSILERFRREWEEKGGTAAYEDLVDAAREAPAFHTLLDTTDERLRRGGPSLSPTEGLETYCRETDQPVPRSEGATTRALLESLAVESAVLIDRLGELAGAEPTELRLVGGGARNPLLCQFVADALDLPVVAGPAEATAMGNLLVQAVGAGTLESIAAARSLVREHVTVDRYEPSDPAAWADVRDRMRDRLL